MLTPEQTLFAIELAVQRRKLGDPIALSRNSLQGLIVEKTKFLEGGSDFVANSEFTAASRRRRSFEGECERLMNAACQKQAIKTLNQLSAVVRKGMAQSEELHSKIVDHVVTEIVENMIPRLESFAQPGDALAVWTDMSTKTAAFFEHAVEFEAKHAVGPFDDVSGCMAVVGLVIQARRLHAEGDLEQAWLNLIDASFFLGAQRGAAVSRHMRSEVTRKRKSMDNASLKHEATVPLKRFVVERYESMKPLGGWKDAKSAAQTLHPLVHQEGIRISQLPERENKQRGTLTLTTVHRLCLELQRLERSDTGADAPIATVTADR